MRSPSGRRVAQRLALASQVLLAWLGLSSCRSTGFEARQVDRSQPDARGAGRAGAVREEECPVSVERELRGVPAVIAPEERVPEFFLASESCEIFDSREMVGKTPFVVVFFASWCSVCEHKLPLVHELVSAREGEMRAVYVSLDDEEGWDETRAFMQKVGLSPTAAVAGRDFVGFALGYNPFRSVPVVVVVGRSGRVVDVQIGVRRGDQGQLIKAIDLAIGEAPEADRLTSAPRR
jgi:thiol-disulfide isomerase/thioredoxin